MSFNLVGRRHAAALLAVAARMTSDPITGIVRAASVPWNEVIEDHAAIEDLGAVEAKTDLARDDRGAFLNRQRRIRDANASPVRKTSHRSF